MRSHLRALGVAAGAVLAFGVLTTAALAEDAAPAAPAAHPAPACNRACLVGVMQRYLDSLPRRRRACEGGISSGSSSRS